MQTLKACRKHRNVNRVISEQTTRRIPHAYCPLIPDEQIHYFNVISESLRGSSVRSWVTPSQSDVTPNAHKCASAPQGHVGTEKKEPPPQIIAELPFEGGWLVMRTNTCSNFNPTTLLEVDTEDLELYDDQNLLPSSSNVRGHAQRTAGSPSKHCPSRVSVTIDTSTRRFDTPRPIGSVVDSASKGTVKVSRKGSKRKDVAQAPNSNAVSQGMLVSFTIASMSDGSGCYSQVQTRAGVDILVQGQGQERSPDQRKKAIQRLKTPREFRTSWRHGNSNTHSLGFRNGGFCTNRENARHRTAPQEDFEGDGLEVQPYQRQIHF